MRTLIGKSNLHATLDRYLNTPRHRDTQTKTQRNRTRKLEMKSRRQAAVRHAEERMSPEAAAYSREAREDTHEESFLVSWALWRIAVFSLAERSRRGRPWGLNCWDKTTLLLRSKGEMLSYTWRWRMQAWYRQLTWRNCQLTLWIVQNISINNILKWKPQQLYSCVSDLQCKCLFYCPTTSMSKQKCRKNEVKQDTTLFSTVPYFFTGRCWCCTSLQLHEVQGPVVESEDPGRGLQRQRLQGCRLNEVQVSGSGEQVIILVPFRHTQGGGGRF